MEYATTVQLGKSTVGELKKIKEHPRETYEDVIHRLVRAYRAMREKSELDEFTVEIQKRKMQELWDNPEDEAWERA